MPSVFSSSSFLSQSVCLAEKALAFCETDLVCMRDEHQSHARSKFTVCLPFGVNARPNSSLPWPPNHPTAQPIYCTLKGWKLIITVSFMYVEYFQHVRMLIISLDLADTFLLAGLLAARGKIIISCRCRHWIFNWWSMESAQLHWSQSHQRIKSNKYTRPNDNNVIRRLVAWHKSLEDWCWLE